MKFTPALIQINVTDGHKAEKFYCDVLGFEKDEDNSQEGVPALKSELGIPVILYTVDNPSRFNYGTESGPVLVLRVDDIDTVHADWLAKGVEFIPVPWSEEESGVGSCPFGRFIAFKDPDGNVHELLQPHS